MKLISLNAFCGKKTEELVEFLSKHQNVDIFCFQEVYHEAHGKDKIWEMDGSNFDLLNAIKKALPDHRFFYRPHLEDFWGLAIFIKKEFPVMEEGEHFVYKHIGYAPEREVMGETAKNLQFVRIMHDNRLITILNFHGLWNGKGKGDTEDRLEQSRKIIEFVRSLKGDYVLWGDFNLTPDTESLQMIGRELGAKELIKEYGITSTRTSLYTKPNKFADYVFVSSSIKVRDFKVLPDIVSDHAPLLLEI